MKKYCVSLLFIGFIWSLPTVSAPITFNTALPVSKNELVLRNQLIVTRASNSSDRETTTSAVSTLAYGATPKLTLFTILPLVDKELETSSERFSNSGLGDIQLLARYTIYQQNSAGKTARVAPFLGVKLPTGDEDRNDSPSIALGTGSSDFFSGVVVTYATFDWTFDSQLAYRNNGSSNGTEFGDAFTFDASFQYRLLPAQLSATSSAFLNGVIELNVIDQEQNTANRIRNLNSGGTSVFISPGLQYITQRWIIEGSVQLPIETNDNLLESDYSARIGIRTNF